MRLLEKHKQTVTVKPEAASVIYQENDRLYRFDGARAFAVRAAILPGTGKASAAVYGEAREARVLMLYDGGETLVQGMGVCVDTAADEPCDYRIAEPPRRYESHSEFTLALIPPELRG